MSRVIVAAYGSLAFPLAAAFIALQVFLPTYYAESTDLSLTTIGFILLLARLCDMATDPLVGYLSDITPTCWQRRKLFVVIAAPLIAVATWFLFIPPANASAMYLLMWTVAIYIAGTLSIVPLGAWGAELSSDYNERSRIAGVRVAFGLLGSLAALLVSVYLAGDNSAELGATLQGIVWLVLVTLLVVTVLAAMLVPDNSDTTLPDNTMAAAWQLIRKPTPFRQLLTSFMLNAIGNAIPASLFVLFVTHVLQEPDRAGQLLFLYFICSAASVPLWVALSRRLGKHRTWTVAMLLASAFFIWTPFLSSGDIHWFYLIVAATGLTIGADLVLPSAINADLIEWDELESGYRRPGLFFALFGTATKLSFALAIGIAFPLLDILGFNAKADNSAEVLQRLALLYGLPCIAFKLAALACMRGYPISEQVHGEIRAQLAARTASDNTAGAHDHQ